VRCRPSAVTTARVAAVAVVAAVDPALPPRREGRVSSEPFEIDALLTLATVAPRGLVKTLMDIEWAADVDEKIAQIDTRLVAVRAVEDEARRRIVESPDLVGKPLPPVPPPAVLREFTVVMAARTAIEKLTATSAALIRKRLFS
jgi:hypothetical protein